MGGRGGSFNNVAESAAYRNALNVAENGIKHDRVETAILLDKHGKVLFTESQGKCIFCTVHSGSMRKNERWDTYSQSSKWIYFQR